MSDIRWKSNDIRWYAPPQWVPYFARGFANWQAVSNIQCTQVSNPSQAAIVVSDEDLGNASELGSTIRLSITGVFDNSVYPVQAPLPCMIRMNSTFPWTEDLRYNGDNHEVGHSLGLKDHSAIPGAAMYFDASNQSNVPIQNDDITRIQAIYGSPITPTPAPLPSPMTVSIQGDLPGLNYFLLADVDPSLNAVTVGWIVDGAYRGTTSGPSPFVRVQTGSTSFGPTPSPHHVDASAINAAGKIVASASLDWTEGPPVANTKRIIIDGIAGTWTQG